MELHASFIPVEVTGEGDEVVIKATKIGAKIGSSKDKSKLYTVGPKLVDSVATSKGGRVSRNHDTSDYGAIAEAWMDGDFLFQKVTFTDKEFAAAVRSEDCVGVSIECDAEADEADMLGDMIGTGVTFVFKPFEPRCPASEGCGLVGAAPTAKHSVTEVDETSIQNQGESMTDETVPKADFVALQAASAAKDTELATLKTERDSLKAERDSLATYKAQVEEARKVAAFEKLKAHLGEEAEAYKDEKPCTMEKMVAAIEKVAAKKVQFSGASAGKTGDMDPSLAHANSVLKAVGLAELE
jgi:hypothetical protein